MKKTFSVSEFKAKSLSLFEKVAESGETLTITKRGKPIAKVIPIREDGEKFVPGKLRHVWIGETDLITPFGAEIWQAAEPRE
jgi:prevent-host-death family protein